jgi:hypothetical protein
VAMIDAYLSGSTPQRNCNRLASGINICEE